MSDYRALLARARERIPHAMSSGARVLLTDPEVLVEGKNTVIRNFGDIVDSIRREPLHLLQYLLKELGTAGNIDGRRAILKRKLSEQQVKERLGSYMATYVMCTECNRPDTHLVKEDRIMILECEACGARRPVKQMKAQQTEKVPVLEERKVYEVMIEDLGKKGDGIARVDQYVIYVPGTSKGSKVRIFIEKISGTVAYARLATE
ncbi:MAG: translation initiation factor IF-2 subunit beta [Euryarchaeota archaeon]|nr:translation initiation factor IF-2 subunit beta [Euryarchaeota archaeon]